MTPRVLLAAGMFLVILLTFLGARIEPHEVRPSLAATGDSAAVHVASAGFDADGTATATNDAPR